MIMTTDMWWALMCCYKDINGHQYHNCNPIKQSMDNISLNGFSCSVYMLVKHTHFRLLHQTAMWKSHWASFSHTAEDRIVNPDMYQPLLPNYSSGGEGNSQSDCGPQASVNSHCWATYTTVLHVNSICCSHCVLCVGISIYLFAECAAVL